MIDPTMMITETENNGRVPVVCPVCRQPCVPRGGEMQGSVATVSLGVHEYTGEASQRTTVDLTQVVPFGAVNVTVLLKCVNGHLWGLRIELDPGGQVGTSLLIDKEVALKGSRPPSPSQQPPPPPPAVGGA